MHEHRPEVTNGAEPTFTLKWAKTRRQPLAVSLGDSCHMETSKKYPHLTAQGVLEAPHGSWC